MHSNPLKSALLALYAPSTLLTPVRLLIGLKQPNRISGTASDSALRWALRG